MYKEKEEKKKEEKEKLKISRKILPYLYFSKKNGIEKKTNKVWLRGDTERDTVRNSQSVRERENRVRIKKDDLIIKKKKHEILFNDFVPFLIVYNIK